MTLKKSDIAQVDIIISMKNITSIYFNKNLGHENIIVVLLLVSRIILKSADSKWFPINGTNH